MLRISTQQCLLCNSLCQFFASLSLSFTISIINITIHSTHSTTGQTREQDFYQLETTQLSRQMRLKVSLEQVKINTNNIGLFAVLTLERFASMIFTISETLIMKNSLRVTSVHVLISGRHTLSHAPLQASLGQSLSLRKTR